MNSLASPLVAMIGQVAAGCVLLVFGRTLFWFFVAVVGFLFGFQLGASVFPDSTMKVVFACAMGVISGLLSVVLEKLLIVLAGAAAGWLLVARLAENLGVNPQLSLLCAVVGAILFAVTVLMVFDVALVVISSLTGAGLIAEVLPLAGMVSLIAFLALFAVGVAVQLRNQPAG